MESFKKQQAKVTLMEIAIEPHINISSNSLNIFQGCQWTLFNTIKKGLWTLKNQAQIDQIVKTIESLNNKPIKSLNTHNQKLIYFKKNQWTS